MMVMVCVACVSCAASPALRILRCVSYVACCVICCNAIVFRGAGRWWKRENRERGGESTLFMVSMIC